MSDRRELLQQLLQESSRTFALAIPLLEEPIREQVSLAYLLLRVADTFEDAELWARAERLAALTQLSAQLAQRSHGQEHGHAPERLARPPTTHRGHLAVLAHVPELLLALERLPARPQALIVEHLQRTICGMQETLLGGGPDGRVVLSELSELRRYCYFVAGIVGELLTELFCCQCPGLSSQREPLLEHASAFGEGLQLVNILKDAHVDALERRSYLPANTPSSAVFELAFEDLRRARCYIGLLERGGASPGVLAFTRAPLLLAEAALTRVQELGCGAKLSRQEVATVLQRAQTREWASLAEEAASHADG